MSRNIPSRKIWLIILPLFIIGGILGVYALIKADERLGPSEMFILIAGLIVVCTILEFLTVWWENRHAYKGASKPNLEMVSRRGIVEKNAHLRAL